MWLGGIRIKCSIILTDDTVELSHYYICNLVLGE